MGLRDKVRTMGFGLPDMRQVTDMFDERFKELIRHIDAGFDRVVAELQKRNGGAQ